MKKKLFKIFAPLVLMIAIIGGVLLGSGCYIISGVKMKKLVGTYELKAYGAKTDRMADLEIECYVVFGRDGVGYTVYKDKDTALQCKEIRCKFTPNQEDSSIYDYVEFDFNGDMQWESFGVNRESLNFSRIKWVSGAWPPQQDYTISVRFEKVSSKTDLSYVNEKYDTKFTPLSYGYSKICGGYEYSYTYTESASGLTAEDCGAKEPVYAFIDLNGYTGKANAYYMAQGGEGKTETMDAAITGDAFSGFSVKLGNETYLVTTSGSPTISVSKTYTVNDEEVVVYWMFNRTRANVGYDFAQEIADRVAQYEYSKAE